MSAAATSEHKMDAPPDESDRWQKMLNWLREGGARFPDLYLKYYSHESRGVHALRDIAPDTTCLFVPLSHLITSEMARASDIGQKMMRSGCVPYSSHTWLAAYVLQERKNASSFWRPYLDCLPREYRNMVCLVVSPFPCHFDADTVSLSLSQMVVSLYPSLCPSVCVCSLSHSTTASCVTCAVRFHSKKSTSEGRT